MFGYTQLYEIHFYIRAISPSHMASYQQVLGLSRFFYNSLISLRVSFLRAALLLLLVFFVSMMVVEGIRLPLLPLLNCFASAFLPGWESSFCSLAIAFFFLFLFMTPLYQKTHCRIFSISMSGIRDRIPLSACNLPGYLHSSYADAACHFHPDPVQLLFLHHFFRLLPVHRQRHFLHHTHHSDSC